MSAFNAPPAGRSETGRRRSGTGSFLQGLWYLASSGRHVRPGTTVGKELLGQPVLLGRTSEGRPFALRDLCPHRGIPLHHGTFDGREVACCYHGWRFGADGRCTAIPSLAPDSGVDVGRIRVRSYPCREVQGNIWVFFDDEKGPSAGADSDSVELPDVPATSFGEDTKPAFSVTMRFPCHADHAIYALMDPAHVAHVHGAWWWKSRTTAELRLKEKSFEPSPLGWKMKRHTVPATTRIYRLLGSEVTSELIYALPGMRLEEIRGDRHRIASFTVVTPVNAEESDVHQCVYASMGWTRAVRPLGHRMIGMFLGQDRDMAALQVEGLAHDPPLMLLGDPDMQSRWLEKLKREWVAARAEDRPFVNPLEPQTLRWRS